MGFLTGASTHAPRQRNSMYVQTVRWSIYDKRQTEHPHLPIRRYKRSPQETPLLTPLHGILPRHGPTLWYSYIYVYGYVYDPMHLRRRHDHCKHCTAASRDLPLLHQFYLIRINWGFNLIRLICGFNLIILTCFYRFYLTHVQRIYFQPESHN